MPVRVSMRDGIHHVFTDVSVSTVQEHFGYLRGLKIAWIGDGNNILHSLMLGCTKLGIDLSFATPKARNSFFIKKVC